MAALTWDDLGKRFYETGVEKGVLYIPDSNGAYTDGVAWNGLTTITESPSGAEGNAQYADNIKYLNLFSAEEFGGTIEALTFPDEFAQFDGLDETTDGVYVAQQGRKTFGLSYKTKLGNDVDGDDHGYKLHLLYGCKASPSEKAYGTINDTPAPIAFSWTLTTTPATVTGKKPTSLIVIDSTKVVAASLTALETILYGTTGVDPALPTPDDVLTAMASGMTAVPTVASPTYVSSTHVITIPTTAGIDYYVNGVKTVAGALAALTTGQSRIITARPKAGYYIADGNIDEWRIDFGSGDRTGTP
jgi:hypothetical protein